MTAGEPELGTGHTGDPRDVAAILAELQSAAAAVGNDADSVVGMFADRPDVVLFDVLAPGLTTLDALRRNAAEFTDATDVVCEYPKVTVRELGSDAAYTMALMRVRARMADGRRLAYHARVTNVWQRIDGRWRAVHEHNSVPVDVFTAEAYLSVPI